MQNRSIQLVGLALAASILAAPQAAQALEGVARLPGLQDASAYLPSADLPLRLELSLSKRQVTLFQDGQPIKTYPVAVGKPGWETPVGDFKIETMIKNPAWANPFRGGVIPGGVAGNPLGTRWMGFWTDGKNWSGFHGTPNRGSIGRAASHGCVRMLDEHARDLFERVKVGTPVIVRR